MTKQMLPFNPPRPMLAVSVTPEQVRFPVFAQPKIDGVRAINWNGAFLSRQLEVFRNKSLQEMFSHPSFHGLDGELVHGTNPVAQDVCRRTVANSNSRLGGANFYWNVFDLMTNRIFGYATRQNQIKEIQAQVTDQPRVFFLESELLHTPEDLDNYISKTEELGFEGVILRSPFGGYKNGRSTELEQLLMRIKNFELSKAIVLELFEGETNNNPAEINALGLTERSTHQKNKEPNGMVGSMMCHDLIWGKKVLVSAGAMTHEHRELFLKQPDLIKGKQIIYKHFPKGTKNKRRMPTFVEII